MDFLKHHPACPESGTLGIEWREALCDQVHIDEIRALRLARQELPGKGCLPCSVWPGYDNDLLLSGHTMSLLDWCLGFDCNTALDLCI
jgi:hypothetical protein